MNQIGLLYIYRHTVLFSNVLIADGVSVISCSIFLILRSGTLNLLSMF